MENHPVDRASLADLTRTVTQAEPPAFMVGPLGLPTGTELVPGFRLDVRLGRGGFGEVWKATGPGGVPVALKILQVDEGLAAVEARALEFMKFIRHPHLVTTFGIWYDERHLVVGMELANGTLMDRLQAVLREGQSGIAPHELIDYMAEAAKGIDFLNQARHTIEGRTGVSVLHRDIKPHNILMFGGGVKVSDFGLAKALERSATGKAAGLTPSYAPPEFFRNSVAKQSDQYSLAVSYYQLRTGTLPFRGSPCQVMAGHLSQFPDLTMLPSEEQPVVARALAKSPAERFPTCRAFVEQLADTLPADVPHPQCELPVVLTNAIGMKLVRIPAGSVVMGSPETEVGRRRDEGPQHVVTITKPLYMGVFSVTQGEYLTVMGQNPAEFQECKGGGSDYPVETVSWSDAMEFCRRLSARFAEKHAGYSYYLPTEAEWEYACRAGTQTAFSTGTSLSADHANFKTGALESGAGKISFLRRTSRAGTYAPNRFGLCDMHGNVMEWCADCYEDGYYARSPESDPLGPRSGSRRVVRGGHWNAESGSCRSASRGKVAPHSCTPFVGFRVVMIPDRQQERC